MRHSELVPEQNAGPKSHPKSKSAGGKDGRAATHIIKTVT